MSDLPSSEAEPAGRRRISLLLLLPILCFTALVILFAFRLGAGDPSRLPSALIGRKVPAFDLPPIPNIRNAAGAAVPGLSNKDLSQGRVTIVNVWASWCAPCRIEHPLLVQLATDPQIRMVGLNYKDKPEPASRFLQQLGNPFAAIGEDASGRVGIDWGVYGVPETFVIGPDGTIRHKHVGPLAPESLPAFLAEIRKAATR